MISVITPVYNGELFIETCIKVIIDQKCLDVEHIIVDGGSRDGTVDIIKRYAENYPHIRWLSEPDQGQSDAMNKGIALAKGEILAILNVDDYYEPNVLNRVAELFQTLPEPSLLVGNCNVWGSEHYLLYVNKPKKLKFVDLLLGHDANPFPENPAAYFYHTALHQAIGPYNVCENYAMDLDFILRAVRVANLVYINETWGNFRRFENTKTFSALQNGECVSNTDRVIKTYQQQLPLFQRWFVALGFKFYKAVEWPRFRYFLEEPRNLLPVLKNKLKRLSVQPGK